MAEIKIKSTHPASQGDFVLIEEEDFDAAKGHELLEPAAPAVKTRGAKRADPPSQPDAA